MKEINIYKFNNNVKVYFTNKRVSLPQDYIDQMEGYWQSLLSGGKKFFRGDIFTVSDISYSDKELSIYVDLTDYAHFLYTMDRKVFDENDCRVIHTSVLIETSDGKFVIGVMNNNTYAPNKLQFIGGGVDKDDIKGNLLDLEHNIRKEIAEEIGLDTEDSNSVKEFRPYFLKDGGESNFLSAIYKLDLSIDEVELMDRFKRFNEGLIKQGISPELSSLLIIKADKNSVESFIENNLREKDENLIPTLKAAVGLEVVKEFIETK